MYLKFFFNQSMFEVPKIRGNTIFSVVSKNNSSFRVHRLTSIKDPFLKSVHNMNHSSLSALLKSRNLIVLTLLLQIFNGLLQKILHVNLKILLSKPSFAQFVGHNNVDTSNGSIVSASISVFTVSGGVTTDQCFVDTTGFFDVLAGDFEDGAVVGFGVGAGVGVGAKFVVGDEIFVDQHGWIFVGVFGGGD